MSVYPSEIVFYGSANMPEADSATVGGAIDFSRRIDFCDMSTTGTVDAISSSASDTATKIVYAGRDGSGVIQTETLTFTGQTAVLGTKSLARILYASLSGATSNGPVANPGGTNAVGDTALIQHTRTVSSHTAQTGAANHSGATPPLFKLQSGDGASATLNMVLLIKSGTGANQIRRITATSGLGTDVVAVNRDWSVVPDNTSVYDMAPGMVFEISPNATTCITRMFVGSSADVSGGATRTFFEKVFAVNNDTATSLTGAAIVKQTDPSGLYSQSGALDFALTTALNDTGTVTNRQTAPGSGIGSFSSGAAPQSISVPGSGNLASGAAPNSAGAQGVWFKLTLPAGASPGNSGFTPRVTGNTT